MLQRAILCAGAIGALAPSLHAQVVVSPNSCAGCTITVNGGNVSIVAPGSIQGQAFSITTVGATDAIGDVSVRVTGGAGRYVVLDIDRPPQGAEVGVRSVRSVVRDPASSAGSEVWIDKLVVWENIGFWDGQTARGLVSVNRVNTRIASERNVLADIEILGSAVPGSNAQTLPLLRVGSINPQYWTDGALHGDVRVLGGAIGRIEVVGGIGSTEVTPIEITCTEDIELIKAGSLSDVAIRLPGRTLHELEINAGGWGGDDTIPGFVPISDPYPPVTGVLTPGGTLEAGRLARLKIRDNFTGVLDLSGQHQPGDLWQIGEDFAASGRMYFPSEGLPHQVVVNARNVGGEFLGQVAVGAYTLVDGYGLTPTYLGGGAVGEAAFRQHGPASVPPPNTTLLVGDIDLTSWEEPPPCVNTFTTLRVEFYGRVSVVNASAVQVHRFDPAFPSAPWRPVGIDVTAQDRTLRIRQTGNQPWEPWDYEYRVTVNAGALRCENLDLPSQQFLNVAPFQYTFSILDGCGRKFDLNDSGTPEGGDVPAFAGDPVDFDQSGNITARDMSILLRGIAEHGAPQP